MEGITSCTNVLIDLKVTQIWLTLTSPSQHYEHEFMLEA